MMITAAGERKKREPLSPERQQKVVSLLEDYIDAPNANSESLSEALREVRYNR